MNYSYKCPDCKQTYDVVIQTSDIMDSVGRIDQSQLEMRMHQQRVCSCGGELKKQILSTGDALWFEMNIGKGKVSSRFK